MQDTWELHTVITLHFPANNRNWSQDVISFSSVKDKDTYERVVDYVLNKKEIIAEYNDVGQFFE